MAVFAPSLPPVRKALEHHKRRAQEKDARRDWRLVAAQVKANCQEHHGGSSTAAHRLSDGAIGVAMGRMMPRPPASSATPMKVARPRVMPVGSLFSDWALNFS